MKQIRFIFAVLVLFPLTAIAADEQFSQCVGPNCMYPESTYPGCTYPGCPEEQENVASVPVNVYEALVQVPVLSKKHNLSDQEKAQLKKYQAITKGLIVVEVGTKGCRPCKKLIAALQSSYGNNPSVMSQWMAKGVHFYQLDWQEDGYSEQAQTLSAMLDVESVPVLAFFSNGKEVLRLEGYDAAKQEQTMQEIMKYTNQYL